MGDLRQADMSRVRRLAQPVLRLDGVAVSREACSLVSHCLQDVILPYLPPQRPSSLAGIERALGATLAGLIQSTGADWGDGWLRRPLSNGSFTGEPVSRVQFGKVLDGLDRAGLLEIAPGFMDRVANRAAATRIRLAETGRKLAADYGMTGSNVGSHFDKVDC
jgi:hypothetical protein